MYSMYICICAVMSAIKERFDLDFDYSELKSECVFLCGTVTQWPSTSSRVCCWNLNV